MDNFVRAVMYLVLLVTLVVWTVIGFIFWIPLLVRATTIFALALLPAAYGHHHLGNLRYGLEAASGFYFRGFRSALAVLNESPTHGRIEVDVRRTVVEILWAASFWLFLLYFLEPRVFSPFLQWLSASFKTAS